MAFQDLVAKLGFDITDWQANVGKAQQGAQGLATSMEKSFSGMADRLKSVSQTLGSFGASWSVAISGPLAALGTLAVATSDKMATARIGFETMLGSAQKADAFIKELAAFAQRTPFDFPGLQAAAQRMLAMGFAANEVVPILTAIGDAVGNLGGGQEKIDRIVLALGQMSAKGRVMAQEMNQLTEAGVKAWGYLADAVTKATGKVATVADVMKMTEKGMLDGAAAARLIAIAMERDFAGGMEKASKLVSGQLSNLRDAIVKPGGPLDQLGKAMQPVVLQWIEDLSGLIPRVNAVIGQFAALSPATQKMIVELGGLAVAIGPVSFALAKFAGLYAPLLSGIGKVIGALPELGKAFAAVGAALGDTGLIGSLTLAQKALLAFSGAVVVAGATLAGFKLTQWAREQSDALGDLVSGLVGPGGFLEALPRKFAELRAEIQVGGGVFGALKKDSEENLAAIGRALSSVDEAIGGPFRRLKDLLSSPLISGAFAEIWEGVKQGARESGEFIQKVIDKFKELKALVPQVPSALEIQGTLGGAARPGAPGVTTQQLQEMAAAQQKLNEAVKAREYDDWIKKLLAGGKAANQAAKEIRETAAEVAKLAQEAQQAQQYLDKFMSERGLGLAQWYDDSQIGLFLAAMTELGPATDAAAMAFARASAALNEMPLAARGQDLLDLASGLSNLPQLEAMGAAFRGIGDSTAQLADKVLAAKQNYDAMWQANQIGIASYMDLEKSELALLQSRQAAGENLTESESARLQRLTAEFGKQKGAIEAVNAAGNKFGKEVSLIFDRLNSSLADAILGGENLGKVFTQAANAIKKAFLEIIIDQVFAPLRQEMVKISTQMVNFLTGLFGVQLPTKDISKIVGLPQDELAKYGIFGGGGGAAKTGGGQAGSAGLLGGVAGVAGLAVTAISDLMSYLQGRRMEQDIGRIEVTTRGILSQAIAQQGALNSIAANMSNLVSATFSIGTTYFMTLYEVITEQTQRVIDVLNMIGAAVLISAKSDAVTDLVRNDLIAAFRAGAARSAPTPADLTGGAGSGPRGGDVLPGAPNIPAAGGVEPRPEDVPEILPPEVQGLKVAFSGLGDQVGALTLSLDATVKNFGRLGDKFVNLIVTADRLTGAFDEEVAKLSGFGTVTQAYQEFFRKLMEDTYGPMQRGTRENPFGRTPEGGAAFVPPEGAYRPTLGPGGGLIYQGAGGVQEVNVTVQAQDPDVGYRVAAQVAREARLNGFGI